MKAILRQIRISPKKVNLVAALVRNKKALDAVDILRFTQKKGAPIIKKVLQSAMANAINNYKQSKEELYLKEIVVTEGPTYKRSVPVSRGRMHPILKRTSHITVKLESREVEAKKPIKADPASDTAEVSEPQVKKVKSIKKTNS